MPPRRTTNSEPAKTRIAFWELLGQKQLRENRVITRFDVIKETGLSQRVIYGASDGSLTLIQFSHLDKLAEYFGVEPGELLTTAPLTDVPKRNYPKRSGSGDDNGDNEDEDE